MALTWPTWTDDDGTGTTGTILNNTQHALDGAAINAAFTSTAVTFSAGNFTGNGAQTWTLVSGDQTVFSYSKIGKRMLVFFQLETTSVGGTPNTDLLITIPGGFTCAVGAGVPFYYLDNGTHGVGLCNVVAAATTIRLLKSGFSNWTAATNTTTVYGQIEFETTA